MLELPEIRNYDGQCFDYVSTEFSSLIVCMIIQIPINKTLDYY